jgi:hypothetical protein
MNNFESVKNILKIEPRERVGLMSNIDQQITELLKQKEEYELVVNEIQEAIKKLAGDNL